MWVHEFRRHVITLEEQAGGVLAPHGHATHTMGPSTPGVQVAAVVMVAGEGVQLGQQAHRREAYRKVP